MVSYFWLSFVIHVLLSLNNLYSISGNFSIRSSWGSQSIAFSSVAFSSHSPRCAWLILIMSQYLVDGNLGKTEGPTLTRFPTESGLSLQGERASPGAALAWIPWGGRGWAPRPRLGSSCSAQLCICLQRVFAFCMPFTGLHWHFSICILFCLVLSF